MTPKTPPANINPMGGGNDKIWCRGDEHPTDGTRFWEYRRNKKGERVERWMDPKTFEAEQQYLREYRRINRAELRLRHWAWRQKPESKAKIRKRGKEYREKNREKIAAQRKARKEKRRKEDPIGFYQEQREAKARHKARYKEKYGCTPNNKRHHRKKSDPLYILAVRCRNRVRHAVRNQGYTKKTKTQDMLGCSWPEFKAHIEQQFADGMSWDNYREWHLDHIIPLSSAETEEDLLALCRYTNIQPMWAEDNLAKGAKMPPTPKKSPTQKLM